MPLESKVSVAYAAPWASSTIELEEHADTFGHQIQYISCLGPFQEKWQLPHFILNDLRHTQKLAYWGLNDCKTPLSTCPQSIGVAGNSCGAAARLMSRCMLRCLQPPSALN